MNNLQYADQLVVDLFDAQPQPVFWMKPVFNELNEIVDFEYTHVNEELVHSTGHAREEIIGSRLFNSPLLNDELKNRYFPQLKEVFETGTKIQDTIYNPVLNTYFSFLRSKVQDGVLTVIQDRTKEYQMISQLESQQSLLNNILQYTSSGISVSEMIRDENGKIIDGRTILANEAAVKFTGIPRDLYLSRTALEIDPAIMNSHLYRMIIDTLETGEPFHTQYYIEPTDRWIELSGSKMDENKVINVFTDITITKKAQLEIERAAENLRKFINTSQSAMSLLHPVYDEKGELVDFEFNITNYAFSSYVGQQPEVIMGDRVSRWFPQFMVSGLFDHYRKTFETGETFRKEFDYKNEENNAWLDIMCSKMEEGVLVTVVDLTHTKQLQFELEKMVAELRRSNKHLEEFAYAASHDLKEPIRKVHTFSDRLKPRLLSFMSPEEASMFDRMQNAVQRMQQLVDDLLAYSSISSSNDLKEMVDLNESLRLVLMDMEVSIEEKKATINIEPLPRLFGNRRQFQQLFQNLISNSIKYSRKDVPPVITIRHSIAQSNDITDLSGLTNDNSSYHLIEFTDNGIGFEEQENEKIFSMFHRLHGRSEYAGTGIGLSIVRKVVENHNGFVKAEGRPGEGARFTILLPHQQQ